MPAAAPEKSWPLTALLLGLAATALVAVCHLIGIDRGTERQALDFRFRHFSSAPANDQVVLVRIDDKSLETYGHWPWPRALMAGIVRILRECGAEALALDIIMPEPQETRYQWPLADVYDTASAPLIGEAGPQVVFDDAELERALRESLVLMPMHVKLAPDEPRGAEGDDRVRRILQADPNAGFASVVRAVLPGVSPGTTTPAVREARRQYWQCRALHHLRRFLIPAERIGEYPAPPGLAMPPLERFARAASLSGFVSFSPEFDGVVRRMPLLARCPEGVYPQFALALAAHCLTRPDGGGHIAANASSVIIESAKGLKRVIPVDSDGCLLINWTSPRWRFRDLSAGAIAYIWQQRQRLEKNRRFSRLLSVSLARNLQQADLLKLFAQADELYRRRLDYLTAGELAVLYDPKNVPPPPRQIDEAERQVEQAIDKLAGEMYGDLDFYVQGLPPEGPRRREITRLAAKHAQLVAANKEIQRDIDQQLRRVGEMVAGKVCILGSSASAAADFVPTPVAARVAGITVHANLLNTITSGRFVTEASGLANVAAILIVGALVAVLAAWLPVLRAGAIAVLLAVGYAAWNVAVAFYLWDWWVVLVAPLAAMVASMLVVTAYRQLTEERAKRQIRGLFAQAMSPALVDQLIQNPSLAKLGGERRVLTCLFSDLEGFTPLAERLGEQQTVRLLNHYFDHMMDVISARYGGYLNKFLGDGILAFFGAPVFQDDHVARAIGAAITCQSEVDLLNEELAAENGGTVRLSARIGVATGEAIVGNCGSSRRMDYTAIGDCVNLASRLESANKQFATKVLVDERSFRHGGDGNLLTRPLGQLRVVGKTEPVGVYEILGRAQDASQDLAAALADFATALDLYTGRHFAEAARKFEAVLGALPGDKPAEIYLALCRRYEAAPPPDTWDGVLQLTSK